MTGQPGETLLRGGRTTPGVVRVDDTVRRPAKANSDFVRRLLRHLAAKGFEGAPRWLGTDEMGREIFSYLEGEVPAELGLFDDPILCTAAMLIRRFHDLAAERVVGTAETVCHNDLSPCNFVFRDGSPVALIDFDATSPGSRAHDLGYAAWLWLNFGISELPPSEQRRRLWLFTDAYGGMDNHVVIHSMMQRQKALAEEGRRQGNRPMASWAAACLKWTRCHQSELTQS